MHVVRFCCVYFILCHLLTMLYTVNASSFSKSRQPWYSNLSQSFLFNCERELQIGGLGYFTREIRLIYETNLINLFAAIAEYLKNKQTSIKSQWKCVYNTAAIITSWELKKYISLSAKKFQRVLMEIMFTREDRSTQCSSSLTQWW